MITIKPEKLTKDNFAPYGEVIEATGEFKIINQGNGKKWKNLVHFDMFQDNGNVNLGILKTKYLDFVFDQMERHFYMSQIFIPLNSNKSIIAVVPVSDQYPNSEEVRAFLMEVN